MLNRWVIVIEFALAVALGALFYALPSDLPKLPFAIGGAALIAIALISLIMLARRRPSSESPTVEVDTITQSGPGSVQVSGEHNTVNVTINPAPPAPEDDAPPDAQPAPTSPETEEASVESIAGQRTPRTLEEVEAVVRYQPRGWEYLSFAGWLVVNRDAVEAKYLDHQARFAPASGIVVADAEALGFIQLRFNEAHGMVKSFERLLDPEVVERAFGVPGEPGDAAKIQHLARRLTDAYEGLLDLAAQLRGANKSSAFAELFERLARLMDEPIEQYRKFVDEFATELDAVPAKLAAGETIRLSFTLTLSINEADADAVSAEIHRLEQAILDGEFDQL